MQVTASSSESTASRVRALFTAGGAVRVRAEARDGPASRSGRACRGRGGGVAGSVTAAPATGGRDFGGVASMGLGVRSKFETGSKLRVWVARMVAGSVAAISGFRRRAIRIGIALSVLQALCVLARRAHMQFWAKYRETVSFLNSQLRSCKVKREESPFKSDRMLTRKNLFLKDPPARLRTP